MTSRDEPRDLSDIEPIAPTDGPGENDTQEDVDRVALAGAAAGGMPAVGVLADATTKESNPETLDPERDDVDRNAAGGGWEGANEVIENDFESEQLRRG